MCTYYVHVYMCTYIHVYMCTCAHGYMCTYVHVAHVYMCKYVHVHMCICVNMYMCTCVYMYICTCAHVYMCVYNLALALQADFIFGMELNTFRKRALHIYISMLHTKCNVISAAAFYYYRIYLIFIYVTD